MRVINLGDIRRQTDGLPDDTEIVIHEEENRGGQSHVHGIVVCHFKDAYTDIYACDGRGSKKLDAPVVRLDMALHPFVRR